MKEYRFRETEGDRYIIPIEEVKQFDWLCEKIDEYQDSDDNEIEHYYDKLNTNYSQYIVEGDLYDIPLFIQEQYLN